MTAAPRRSRPAPSGYFSPADAGVLLDWAPLQQRLAETRNYWVSTASGAGVPHAMPVWGVWDGQGFTFSTGPTTRKARNLYENPTAVVHLEDAAAALVVECVAAEVADEVSLTAFLEAYNPKYQWDFRLDQVARGVFHLSPVKAFAWLGDEGDRFSATATRFDFRAHETRPDASNR